MNLRHLRYFLAVAEELSFTAAAKRLCITQPPLSRQIKELEDEIGGALFVRDGNRVLLTPAGAKLREDAYGILAHCQSVLQATRAVAAGEVGMISIGYMPVGFCYSPFLETLKRFRQRYPRVQLSLTQMSPAEQLQAIRAQRLDFGIVHLNTVTESDIVCERIFAEQMELLLPADHPLAVLSDPPLPEILAEPLVLMTRRWCPPFFDALLQIWHRYQVVPNIVQETESFATNLALVASGMGITIGSSALRRHFTAQVHACVLPEADMQMGADLIWMQSRSTPPMERFVAVLRDCRAMNE